MKHVTIREFQTNPTLFLKDLPIVLVKYDKPIAIVRPYTELGASDKVIENIQSAQKSTVKKSLIERPSTVEKNSKGKDTIVNQFSLCPKHKVMYKTCGC
jgi:hypothetical protein